MIRKHLRITSGALALLLGLSPLSLLHAQTALKIGVVNTRQLMQDSPLTRAMQRAMLELEDEFAPRKRELENRQKELRAREEKLRKEAPVMSQSEREKQEADLRASGEDFMQKVQQFEQEYEQRRAQEEARLTNQLLTEIRSYAQANGFDLVLGDGVLFAKDTINITPAIVTALESKMRTAPSQKPASEPAN